MKNHIFISGLGHSGSTILQFMLAKDSSLNCIGEIGSVISDKEQTRWGRVQESRCSCGKLGPECMFWSQHLTDVDVSDRDLYKNVLEHSWGLKFKAVVDSSKRVQYYDLCEKPPKVIFMVRDFRSWAVSAINLKKRKEELKGQKRRKYGYIYECYRYLYQNMCDMRAFRKRKADILYVSYERMVFDSIRETERIYEFMEMDVCCTEAGIRSKGNTHILLGNRMKNNSEVRDKIIYSYMWMFMKKVMIKKMEIKKGRFLKNVQKILNVFLT